MQSLQATGFFCEDIRAEKQGTESVVGIFPDKINLPQFPATLPKLSLYLRLVIDSSDNDVSPIAIRFIGDNPSDIGEIGKIESATIEQALKRAVEDKRPIAGIVARVAMSGFTPTKPGRLLATIDRNGQSIIVASVEFALAPNN